MVLVPSACLTAPKARKGHRHGVNSTRRRTPAASAGSHVVAPPCGRKRGRQNSRIPRRERRPPLPALQGQVFSENDLTTVVEAEQRNRHDRGRENPVHLPVPGEGVEPPLAAARTARSCRDRARPP